ncbi:glycosyltransferase [Streptomyces sp. B-S-A8]|uniref:Glycosyltransferase n=1 Tax=Streptomyces solicavernae TaxID=3043614 RepID=A0ABT6S1S1_9ACTN|nr:glycosyltransferase [Streptomyces sp. B-S-A8]MDI3390635.1 glycosyltransferase [Streptomyces sp. B-S-A8]
MDDPGRPSGGNVYDLALFEELPHAGWQINALPVGGSWPRPDAAALRTLAQALASLPDGAVVLFDGLIGSAAPDVLEAEAERLRLVVLVHLPLRDETGLAPEVAAALDAGEGRALRTAATVVTVSESTAQRLAAEHGLPLDVVHVAEPGARIADAAYGSTDRASELLCVASITPRKGHLVLVEALAALAALADLPAWRCRLVGPFGDPAYVARVRTAVERHGLAERITLDGPLAGAALTAAYAAADVTVLATTAENNPLVVRESLTRGFR